MKGLSERMRFRGREHHGERKKCEHVRVVPAFSGVGIGHRVQSWDELSADALNHPQNSRYENGTQ